MFAASFATLGKKFSTRVLNFFCPQIPMKSQQVPWFVLMFLQDSGLYREVYWVFLPLNHCLTAYYVVLTGNKIVFFI